MYVKLLNGTIQKFPYSIGELKKDNPNVSFPENPSKELLQEYGVFFVVSTGIEHDANTQVAIQNGCVYNESKQRWETAWSVYNLTEEEIFKKIEQLKNDVQQQRMKAYQNESDPLFFKAQRGEATIEEWKASVESIKLKYPYI